eukprot:CCRYP_010901-RB/>CCRYP_010901-RB protein AED:0.02 eAED:0.02 QI:81/-1/1/1/-1/1/1/222/305
MSAMTATILPIHHKWHHAVNSQDKLNAALAASKTRKPQYSIDSIEADIIYSDAKQQAVMGHPPARDGDLTLHSFLHQLQQADFQYPNSSSEDALHSSTNRIVKLDFKCMAAFQSSITHVQSYLKNIPRRFHHLIWVNADILPGPGEDQNNQQAQCKMTPKFNAAQFLQEVTEHLAGTTLSVGWTTALFDTKAKYTNEMVQEMLAVLKPYEHLNVTFPIRATSFLNSWDALQALYKNSWTVTLWWSLDALSQKDLDWIYRALEEGKEMFRNRTYYDLVGFDEYLDFSCQDSEPNEVNGRDVVPSTS